MASLRLAPRSRLILCRFELFCNTVRRCLIHPNASLMPSTTKLASHRLPFLFLSTFDPHSTPCSATQPKSRRKDLRCTAQTNDIIAIMPDLNTGLLQRTSSAHSPSLQIPISLQVTTNQPRPRPKAFPRARTHLSLLAYHSGPRIRAHSLPSPIKPATASQTPRPASIHSAYPLNLASFAAPQQIEILRRALSSPAARQPGHKTQTLPRFSDFCLV
jgi:hypothetical protein